MNRARGAVERIRSLGPETFDTLLAGAFLVAGVIEALVISADGNERPYPLVVTVVLAALVRWRRSIPAVGLVTFGASLPLGRELAPSTVDEVTVPFMMLFVFAYSLGAYGSMRSTVVGGVLAAVTIGIDVALHEGSPSGAIGSMIFASLFVIVPVSVGRSMRNRRLLTAALAEKAALAERERDERARRAVDEERARIARELHDVVAHSISVMTVQATAVERIAERMPEQARTSLENIENTGREALTEMRRLLGVLRRDDAAAAELAPQPSLGRVELLAQRARSAGLDVELRIEGERRPLPAGIDLAAYRVVQEALGDAVGRAGTRHARVTITYGTGSVRIEVVDDGAGHVAEGDGELLGMRERVALYGGSLEGGPSGDGGYAVRARLPLERVAA
jgi:signal transduction histidine kinase